jgi:hypothetical protein
MSGVCVREFRNSSLNNRAVIVQSVQRWATDWTIRVLRFDSRRGLEIFLFTTASRTALGPTQPPIQWVPGALSLGIKRPGSEAPHSPPSSQTMNGATHPLPQYAFIAWCLVKAQGQLYLYHCLAMNNGVFSKHLYSDV